MPPRASSSFSAARHRSIKREAFPSARRPHVLESGRHGCSRRLEAGDRRHGKPPARNSAGAGAAVCGARARVLRRLGSAGGRTLDPGALLRGAGGARARAPAGVSTRRAPRSRPVRPLRGRTRPACCGCALVRCGGPSIPPRGVVPASPGRCAPRRRRSGRRRDGVPRCHPIVRHGRGCAFWPGHGVPRPTAVPASTCTDLTPRSVGGRPTKGI